MTGRKGAFDLSDDQKIELIQKDVENILNTLGMDLTDDSLKGTPKRVAKMFVKEIFGCTSSVTIFCHNSKSNGSANEDEQRLEDVGYDLAFLYVALRDPHDGYLMRDRVSKMLFRFAKPAKACVVGERHQSFS